MTKPKFKVGQRVMVFPDRSQNEIIRDEIIRRFTGLVTTIERRTNTYEENDEQIPRYVLKDANSFLWQEGHIEDYSEYIKMKLKMLG